jgi:plastocyanin
MRILVAIVGLGLFGPTALAWAADHIVHQKARMFSSDVTTIRRGEVLTFLNDDTVPHNVFSTSAGNEFNLGSQRPGLATDVKFTSAGEVEIICAIHPRMRMTIMVME